MHLIVCVDDRYGMLFNDRRLSSDRILTEKICALCAENMLWVDPYTEKLFQNVDAPITVSENPLQKASVGEWCFLEKGEILPYQDQIESVTLCRWNRKYPADRYFPLEIIDGRQPTFVEEFRGNSHEKITVERYVL